MRRLALLQQVAQLSNPRFGIDQSLAGVLARVRGFFQADCCLLVLRDQKQMKCVYVGPASEPG